MDTPAPTASDNVLLEWEAPSRPFKPRSQEFYRTIGAIVFLIVIILFFVREILLIMVVLSLLFVMYVLSSVPPEKIKNKVTTLGVQTGEHFHKWQEMTEFWFDLPYGEEELVVHLAYGFPAHLQLLLGSITREEIKTLLAEQIPFRDTPERTFLDRASEWMVEKIPLERATT
jgi:hypothetical protein